MPPRARTSQTDATYRPTTSKKWDELRTISFFVVSFITTPVRTVGLYWYSGVRIGRKCVLIEKQQKSPCDGQRADQRPREMLSRSFDLGRSQTSIVRPPPREHPTPPIFNHPNSDRDTLPPFSKSAGPKSKFKQLLLLYGARSSSSREAKVQKFRKTNGTERNSINMPKVVSDKAMKPSPWPGHRSPSGSKNVVASSGGEMNTNATVPRDL